MHGSLAKNGKSFLKGLPARAKSMYAEAQCKWQIG